MSYNGPVRSKGFPLNVIPISCLKKTIIACVCVVVASLSFVLALPSTAYALEEGPLSGDSSAPVLEGNTDASVSIGASHPVNGWEYDVVSDQWSYYQNSTLVKGWLYVGGFWYWFDDEGIMAVGLTECGTQTYYLNMGNDASTPYGAMKTGWAVCDDGWRFFSVSGAMERCWLFDGSNWYWLDSETGVMATGVTQCGSRRYCFNASGSMVVGWACDGGVWYYAAPSGELRSGWQYIWGAWYWLDPSTKAMATGLVNDGSNLYAMGASGAMQTGWTLVDSAWYHAGPSGVLDAGWYWDGSSWYWLDPGTRVMATGWLSINGSNYYLDGSRGGRMATGWVLDGDLWYWLFSSGAQMRGGWLHSGGAWYWIDSATGAMATGLVDDGSNFYVMGASGAMQTGWAQSDGVWYHAAGSGVLDTGWYWDGAHWYWLDLETRAMATGEFEAYGDHYYSLADGAIQMSGWAPYGDGLALLKSNGAVIFVAGKNASGAPVVQSGAQSTVRGDSWEQALPGFFSVDGKTFYANADGELQSGWVCLGDSHYFFDSDYVMQTGWCWDGSSWYWLDSDGSMTTGWRSISGSWYFFDDSGIMATGWKQCGEAWYFFNDSGSMRTGWLSWGGAWYYLDSSGAMRTGWLHDGSAWYWLDEATGRMASSGWYDCDGARSWFNASGVWIDASGSVLGVSRQRLLEQLISHENDSYYLGTRYDTSLSPVSCIYPNGEPRSDGFTGMNCGGFVSHVYAKAGGDLSKIANSQSNSPWPGGPGRGSFCNAYRWYGYAIDSGATVLQFNSVSELLASGQARKGDLVFFYPFNPYSTDCHIGFFWGDTPYENRFWHSFGGMGNSISEFVSDGPSWVILMR